MKFHRFSEYNKHSDYEEPVIYDSSDESFDYSEEKNAEEPSTKAGCYLEQQVVLCGNEEAIKRSKWSGAKESKNNTEDQSQNHTRTKGQGGTQAESPNNPGDNGRRRFIS